MNTSVGTAVLAFLLVAATLFAQGQAISGDPSLCCFEFINKPIPQKNLVSYEHTNHMCAIPAVIFTTKGNRRICANPQDKWTQSRIDELSRN
ncbi:C-C motif chemokine 5-like [Sceloporus undulatus]|uniref:C-C motif chemokine 5-like n=1 Tax=Sceloporus undulatus TaxID=8520 RepID=UPI001C4AC4A5|nr:C-C motif chemokine 5-like [Sceloporus undulatus]